MKRYDAIVIGGGHNGLVTAAYLARAKKSVLVLERRPRVGGAAVTEEIFPGFKFTMFSYVVSLLRPEIIRDLDLPRHGLPVELLHYLFESQCFTVVDTVFSAPMEPETVKIVRASAGESFDLKQYRNYAVAGRR